MVQGAGEPEPQGIDIQFGLVYYLSHANLTRSYQKASRRSNTRVETKCTHAPYLAGRGIDGTSKIAESRTELGINSRAKSSIKFRTKSSIKLSIKFSTKPTPSPLPDPVHPRVDVIPPPVDCIASTVTTRDPLPNNIGWNRINIEIVGTTRSSGPRNADISTHREITLGHKIRDLSFDGDDNNTLALVDHDETDYDTDNDGVVNK
jgi:hypothetical protein